MMICPFCNSNKVINTKVTFSVQCIQKCQSCKIAFTYPFPNIPDYELMDFHSCTKEKENKPQQLTNVNSLAADWQKLIAIQSGMIEKYLPANSRVLEIGCGEGLLLSELNKKNYNVSGIEPSQAAYKRALLRNIDAKNGFFPQQEFEKKFDVVIMSHVLEHIENPGETINEIKKIAPSGYLLLSQTNYMGLIPRILKEKWYAWVPEQHFWHFTLNGLNKFLSQFGYVNIESKYSSLIHPNNTLYKIASLYPKWIDQFTALYKLNS